jgi:phytoene desaturase
MAGSSNRVVVIGSGFGGLAVAIRLQARGYKVTIVDQRDQPGGRAYVYRDAGFSFDAGPTVVTAPFLFEELYALAGRRMEDFLRFLPVSPFYRIRFHDGRCFDYCGDAEKMVEEVRKLSPKDVDGYQAFLAESERIFRVGFEELGDLPFSRLWDMVRITPAMVRLRSYLTVHKLVSRYVRHPDLRTVLSFHPLLVGGNPFQTTSIYALILYLERKWGVWFAAGGTGAIVKALVELYTSLGGTLRQSETVEEILVQPGPLRARACGVRLRGGATLPADLIVSNADVGFTYRHLLPEYARHKYSNQRIERMRYSMGLFVAYFGTAVRYPDIAHHTILLGPRYKGLISDIFDRQELAEDFSLYLHRPTVTDESLAPAGCDAFYVLSPVPHLHPAHAAEVDWETEGPRYRDRIYAHLEQSIMPRLREPSVLLTTRHITPRTFESELSSLYGSGFSIEPILRQSAYFRPHNRSEDVDGLYFVGGGTHPGAGMPGVLSTAKVVDRLIPRLPGVLSGSPIAGTHA